MTLRELLCITLLFSATFAARSWLGEFGLAVGGIASGGTLFLYGLGARKSWPKLLGVPIAVLSFGLLAIVLLVWLVLGVGPIWNRGAWPRPVRQMVLVGKADVDTVRVHGLGSFLDSEYVWQFHIDPNDVQAIVSEYGMSLVPAGKQKRSEWPAPKFSSPPKGESVRVYATPHFPVQSRGADGEHFLMAVDDETSRVWIWYKSNF